MILSCAKSTVIDNRGICLVKLQQCLHTVPLTLVVFLLRISDYISRNAYSPHILSHYKVSEFKCVLTLKAVAVPSINVRTAGTPLVISLVMYMYLSRSMTNAKGKV